jgi:superfamily II DNA/RNA helicase
MLLNFGDNPEVEWLLDGMVNDYQLVLASATVNKRVEKFVGEVMELEVGQEGYVVVGGGDSSVEERLNIADGISMDVSREIDIDPDEDAEVHAESHGGFDSEPNSSKRSGTPIVRHWSMAASHTSRITLTADLIITLTPRRAIAFVPTKAEVESVAQALTERLSAKDVGIHILHGDMVQQARSRTIHAFRDDSARISRILVATDVAARGLDLPSVDLVLQYGVPRKTGKDGTYDSELYIHRTGRAGRFGNTRSADAILLYDRTQGETATLIKLGEEMENLHNVVITPRQLPSPSEVMDASYERVMKLCCGSGTRNQSLVQYFAEKLAYDLTGSNGEGSESGPSEKESLLIHRLATAMASLSGLDGVVPARSLLTADPGDRTIRVWKESCDCSNPLSPSEVTKLVKSLDSGKLGRIFPCDDGSVVFDLGAKKANLLLERAENDASIDRGGWHFEFPDSLTTII